MESHRPRNPGRFTAGPRPATRTQLAIGPSAEALSHGQWIAIPKSPIKLNAVDAVWTGKQLFVVNDAYNCRCRGAAEYNPVRNRWTQLAAPPLDVVYGGAEIAWTGHELVAVSGFSGAAAAWSPKTMSWRAIASFPQDGIDSLLWSGSALIGAASDSQTGVSSLYALTKHGWSTLASPPSKRQGSFVDDQLLADSGSVYLYQGGYREVTSNHSSSFVNVGPDLYRLTASGWVGIALAGNPPVGQLTGWPLLGDRLLITGSSCGGACTEEDAADAVVDAGSGSVVTLGPRVPLRRKKFDFSLLPYPRDVTGGGNTVVVTYPSDSIIGKPLPTRDQPAAGTTLTYDVTNQRWFTAPRTPADQEDVETFWTSFGVVSLGGPRNGDIGGYLLKPNPAG